MGDLVPRKELVKQGMKGVGGVIGGVVLLGLSAASGVIGWIVGGLLTVVGIGASASKEDRTAGLITAGAGILTLVATVFPGVGHAAKWLLITGGIGLLITGGYSLIRFIINLKKRS